MQWRRRVQWVQRVQRVRGAHLVVQALEQLLRRSEDFCGRGTRALGRGGHRLGRRLRHATLERRIAAASTIQAGGERLRDLLLRVVVLAAQLGGERQAGGERC